MRVFVLQGLMGNGKPYPIQQGEQDLPDNIARDLISRGLAEPIIPIESKEVAAIKKPGQTRAKKRIKKA